MKALSNDLRQRILDAYDAGEGSIRTLAERFAINKNTLRTWLACRRQTGRTTPLSVGSHLAPTLDAAGRTQLLGLLGEKNDRTQQELADEMGRRYGIRLSRATVGRVLARLGITRKKKTMQADERSAPKVRRRRARFLVSAQQLDPQKVLFLDEFGMNLGMTRPYGYAWEGERAFGHAPYQGDPHVTLVFALGLRGVVGSLAFRGAMNEAVFEGYVHQVLAPHMKEGDVVIWDRLSAHFVPGAAQAIEARGAVVLRLPGYAPDLNPIEESGGYVKDRVRGDEPRTLDALYASLGKGLRSISSSHIEGWFHDRAPYLFPAPASLCTPQS